ncbi:MAG: response regulator transcription factor [Promethearchaeota archaeon]|jgi:CheY-like chemotaxis protein
MEMLLIVDDNEDILFNLKILLEKKGFDVKTASNGENALNLLLSIEKLPEVIISDIMMPKMNGYEFFAAVSAKAQLNQIPFLFLTAKSTPEDIRLGKMLGVDDYITKPFNERDLIASVSGKINRNKRSNLIDAKIKQLLNLYDLEIQPSISKEDESPMCLMLVFWDDIAGPILKNSHPLEKSCHLSINTIGKQLFNAATSIYGQNKITQAEGILLNIENIKKKGYLFFDSVQDTRERYGQKQYMLSIIAPNITYFDSLKIREVLKEISEKIKWKKDWDIKIYWEMILEILSEGSLLLKPQ